MQSGLTGRVAAPNIDRTSETGRAAAVTAEFRPGRAATIVQPLVLDDARAADGEGFGDSNYLIGNPVHEPGDFDLVGAGDHVFVAAGWTDAVRHVAPVSAIGDEPIADVIDCAGIIFRPAAPDIRGHSNGGIPLALDADVLTTVKTFVAGPQDDAPFGFADWSGTSGGWASAMSAGQNTPGWVAAASLGLSEPRDAAEARSAPKDDAAADAMHKAGAIASNETEANTPATNDERSATERPAGATEGATVDRSILAGLANSAANAMHLVPGLVHTWDVIDVPAVEQWKGSTSGNHGLLFGDRSDGETARNISWLEVNGNTVVQADVSGHATPDLQITLPGTHLNLPRQGFPAVAARTRPVQILRVWRNR